MLRTGLLSRADRTVVKCEKDETPYLLQRFQTPVSISFPRNRRSRSHSCGSLLVNAVDSKATSSVFDSTISVANSPYCTTHSTVFCQPPLSCPSSPFIGLNTAVLELMLFNGSNVTMSVDKIFNSFNGTIPSPPARTPSLINNRFTKNPTIVWGH